MWSVLLPALVLLLAAGGWYSAMSAREQANTAARKLCSQQGLTLLEDMSGHPSMSGYIEQGFEVDCDCTLRIAAISGFTPRMLITRLRL